MTREEAYQLMIQNKNLQKHGLAVEAIMKELCKYLRDRESSNPHPSPLPEGEGNQGSLYLEREFNEEEWAIVGLLHDADYELIEKDPTRHTLVTEEKLRELGETNERIINGIKAH